ncbi:MAG: hypothetical protein L6Q99_02910 [Planctomycetes bacterium]|nr:hypothetical protein [Planctomycetota bacterium]
MAGSLLFVVHGMGVHAPGWEAEVRTKLEEVAGRYSGHAANPAGLWNDLELVPVGYDDILSDAIDRWRTNAGGIADFARRNAQLEGLDADFLEKFANEDPNFFWTHVCDVLLYRFFELYRKAIRARVAKQIVDRVRQLPNDAFDDCSVLAHSLGTAVTHDTLHLLATSTFGGASKPYGVLNSRFRAIVMLANTSRVLQTEFKAYDSVVRGGSRTSKVSNCSQFMSWRHEWDPICLVRRFAPDKWPTTFNWIDSVSHFREANVHGFTHYLDNPRIHIPLLELALGKAIAKPSERIDKVDKYEKFGGRLRKVPEIEALVAKIFAEIARLNENSDWATLLDVLRKLKALIEQLKPLIAQLKAELAADIA